MSDGWIDSEIQEKNNEKAKANVREREKEMGNLNLVLKRRLQGNSICSPDD